MRYPEVHGGSGYVAVTVADLGYEPTMGATSSDVKPTRTRRKTIEVGKACLRPAFQQRGFQLRNFGWWGFSRGYNEARSP